MKYSGTISRGVRTPIIKKGDDLASIVVDSVCKCVEEANLEINDKDVVAITEAVVGISQGNYATADQIAKDVNKPFDAEAKAKIDDGVRNAAYKIIDGKGATFYGIAGALTRICAAISNNEYAILTVSSRQDDVEGVKGVCLSLPTVLGKRGVLKVIYPNLDAEERAELKKSATGTLRIGASETIFQYILADKIVAYHKLCPQVKIELISDVSPRIIEFLKTDRCDVGFLNLPFAADDGIVLTDTVALLNDVFVAGNAFSELKGRRLSVWDLCEYPLLLLEPNTVARAAVDHFAESLGAKLVPAVEVGSWDFMKRLVTEGMGIGCLPREYAMRRLADGELFELDVTPAMPTRSVGLALPKNANIPYSLRAFMNLVRREG